MSYLNNTIGGKQRARHNLCIFRSNSLPQGCLEAGSKEVSMGKHIPGEGISAVAAAVWGEEGEGNVST